MTQRIRSCDDLTALREAARAAQFDLTVAFERIAQKVAAGDSFTTAQQNAAAQLLRDRRIGARAGRRDRRRGRPRRRVGHAGDARAAARRPHGRAARGVRPARRSTPGAISRDRPRASARRVTRASARGQLPRAPSTASSIGAVSTPGERVLLAGVKRAQQDRRRRLERQLGAVAEARPRPRQRHAARREQAQRGVPGERAEADDDAARRRSSSSSRSA